MNEISENKEKKRKKIRQTRKTGKPLPDPRMSVEKQIKILKALHQASEKGEKFVPAKDIAPLAGAHETQAGGVASFFYKIGLLDRDKYKYKPKETLVDFCNELEWSPDTAGNYLQSGFKDTWFGETIRGLFGVNKEISKEELIKNLGRVAEADKFHKQHLSILIDFLEYSKMIKIDESTQKYQLTSNVKDLKKQKSQPDIEDEEKNQVDIDRDSAANEVLSNRFESDSKIGTNININLDVKFSDETNPEELANKIKRFKELIK